MGLTVSGSSTGETLLLIDVSATGAEAGVSAGSEAGTTALVCDDFAEIVPELSPPPHPLKASIPARERHCTVIRKFKRIFNPRLRKAAWKCVVITSSVYL
jgi:hypothetical protein